MRVGFEGTGLVMHLFTERLFASLRTNNPDLQEVEMLGKMLITKAKEL